MGADISFFFNGEEGCHSTWVQVKQCGIPSCWSCLVYWTKGADVMLV